MSRFDDEELSKIKATCFRGIARIQLTALNFDHPLVQRKHRSVSQKNVRRLRGIFEKVDCLRLQEENFINAIVDDASLDDALTLSGVSRDGLLCLREGQELPLLNLRVDCLSGLHRVEAAKAYLDDNDQWWVVRLFTNGTPKSVLSRIVELYSNEQRPADGEIFRKILLYRRLHDELSENQWWAYLDKSKPKDLRQLLKNQLLASAFGSLVDMPGLWAKLQLGALHRLLALKCVEEMLRYLHHIKKIWNIVLRCGDTTLPYSAVDDVTADELEGLCPKYSASDRDYVSGLMQDGVIFPLVVDESLRRALLANICSISSLIPSLWTFFETLKYLEPVCDILKRLIGNKMKGTIRRSLLGLFFPPERIRMQKSESHDMEWRAQSDQVQAAEIAYMELWAVCGRHFNGLTTFTPKKENGKDKPAIKEPNPVLWQCIARFALDRGFRIPAAEQLAAQDSRSSLAIDYLRKANPLLVDFSAAQIQTAVLAGSTTDISAEEEWQLSTTQLDVERRFGRPFESDLEVDKRTLFVPMIYRDQDLTAVNLPFVRRDLFRCLFGSFRFQDADFSPPFPSILAQGSRPSVAAEIKKRSEPSNDSDQYAQKRRRLDHEMDRLNDDNRELTGKVASLARANKMLKANHTTLKERCNVTDIENGQLKTRLEILGSENAKLKDRLRLLESQSEDVDISDAPNPEVQDDEHDQEPQDVSQALPQQQDVVLRNAPLSLEALHDLAPGENPIAQLVTSHQHIYSDQLSSNSNYEIFIIKNITSEMEIRGLSFPISPSVNGIQQVERLMNYVTSFWAEGLRQPGPFIVSLQGKMMENSAVTIHAACKWHGTCFVGSREDVDKLIQIVKTGKFEI